MSEVDEITASLKDGLSWTIENCILLWKQLLMLDWPSDMRA